MPEKTEPKLKNVAETLLIPLYYRAIETQRPDALIKDDKAVEMIERLDCDFSRLQLRGHDKIAVIMRVMQFDRFAREFLVRNPDGAIVHIGCGLDTRFERVDNGRVEWYDLDLPEVVELRQKLVSWDMERYHLLSGSVFDVAWMEALQAHSQRPKLFLAEGVFPYFEEAQIKSLVLALHTHFPGAELVCDGLTPLMVRLDNLQLTFAKIDARLHWGLKHGIDVESWGDGISLLEEWFYYQGTDPRMSSFRWMRFFPALGKGVGIFHYKLG